MNLHKINIDPVSKPRMTQRDKWKPRKCVNRYWGYKDKLLEWKEKEEFNDSENTVLVVTFYIPMPQSWSKKKKAEKEGSPHDQKPDIDNLIKGFLDAVYEEDKYVYHIIGSKFWAREGLISLMTF